MLSTIKSIIKTSNQVAKDLAKLESYTGRDEYQLIAQFTRAFIDTDYYDADINKFIATMEERELHNHIASLSYQLPNFGINHPSLYLMEKAKVSLASTILHTYMTEYGSTREEERAQISIRGVKTWYKIYYIGADKESVAKNKTFGIHTEPAQCPVKYIKGKAGVKGLKTPRHLVRYQKDISSMEFRIVHDIDFDLLYQYLLTKDEYKSTVAGSFLTKAQKKRMSKIELEIVIGERVADLETRYKEDIEIIKHLIEGQSISNLPYYLSIHFDYRGRQYYDLIMTLLNPQSKVGKYMWEAFTPRILNELDYKWLAFSVCSANKRINPSVAVQTFEEDEEALTTKFLKEHDYLELTYRKRVLLAIEDYRKGIPNRTFIFKDYTNGGAIHFSTSLTREPKAMGVCNLFDVTQVNDAHGLLREAFNKHTGLEASRDDIKKAVSQGVIAGISPRSAVAKIKDYFLNEHQEIIEITESEYMKIATDVYGKTAELFHEYNKFGNELLDNNHSYLPWKTKDGFPARSIAFIKAQEVKAYYVSTAERDSENLPQIKLLRDMPMHYIRDGKRLLPALEGEKNSDGTFKYAKAKVSGFLANSTHSIDGTSVRALGRAVVSIGAAALFIHDNIATSGFAQELVLLEAQKDILENFATLPFVSIMNQVAEGRKQVPNFTIGKQQSFSIGGNFLQA
jgi:hypothetical protein